MGAGGPGLLSTIMSADPPGSRSNLPDKEERTNPSATDISSIKPHAGPSSEGSGSINNTPALAYPFSTFAIRCAGLSNSAVNSFCGAMAGVASGIVTCPLDVIKTRLQAQGSFRRTLTSHRSQTAAIYSGLMNTAKTIWQQDGIRGMYRGLGPMVLGYLPTWAVYMSVYDASKEYYYGGMDNKWLARFYASITAGACSTLATNPIWVIKTRLMSQVSMQAPDEARPPWQYRGTLDAAQKMYRSEGIRVFYSGLAPALLGLSHVAIQFPLYEYLKQKFTGLEMGENTNDSDTQTHWVGISAATFLSKVCATSATYPHEVLRTRLQTQQRTIPQHSHEEIAFRGGLGHGHVPKAPGTSSSDGMINIPRYRGMMRTVRMILKEEGWRAFYHGMGTNMLRAVPAAMTTMLTFETLKTAVCRVQREGRLLLEQEDGL